MLISLSGKKRSGKTTVANHLISKYNFKEVSWAEPLKEIIGKQLFEFTDDQLYGAEECREAIVDRWGMSPRKILQLVGTDCFRRVISDDFWVTLGLPKINALLAQGENVVISDSRFPNEVMAVKNLGGTTIEVRKIEPFSKSQDKHESEHALDDWEFDYTIQAVAGDLDALYKKIEEIYTDLRSENAFSEGV